MRAYLHILARFVAYWGHLPPEAIATVLFAAPEMVGFLAGLPYILNMVAGGLVSWWFTRILEEHVWPDVPPEHRRLLAVLRDVALLKKRGGGPRRLRGVRITYLPHALERMGLRGISEGEVRAVLEGPDLEFPGRLGRTVAERVPPGRRLATRVVYDLGQEDERIVVTVELGRPTSAPSEGGEA